MNLHAHRGDFFIQKPVTVFLMRHTGPEPDFSVAPCKHNQGGAFERGLEIQDHIIACVPQVTDEGKRLRHALAQACPC